MVSFDRAGVAMLLGCCEDFWLSNVLERSMLSPLSNVGSAQPRLPATQAKATLTMMIKGTTIKSVRDGPKEDVLANSRVATPAAGAPAAAGARIMCSALFFNARPRSARNHKPGLLSSGVFVRAEAITAAAATVAAFAPSGDGTGTESRAM